MLMIEQVAQQHGDSFIHLKLGILMDSGNKYLLVKLAEPEK